MYAPEPGGELHWHPVLAEYVALHAPWEIKQRVDRITDHPSFANMQINREGALAQATPSMHLYVSVGDYRSWPTIEGCSARGKATL